MANKVGGTGLGTAPEYRHDRELALLTEQAKHGQLVLFVGAGVSKGANLPDWRGLSTRV
ncbi:MAG: hypothetical protein ACOX87_15000 [Chloroflexota bacterium]